MPLRTDQYKKLRTSAFEANMELYDQNLVKGTFGNVSAIDREQKVVAIKPSGVKYHRLRASDIVIIDYDGKVIDGTFNPSSDTPTHLVLYRQFPSIGGIAHTHSTYATAWAQAGKSIPCLGTTHADYCYGSIPCTSPLTDKQIENGYEHETGLQIVKSFRAISFSEVPMVLVRNHGVFTWGKDAQESVFHCVMAEEIAKMAFLTCLVNRNAKEIGQGLLNKHFFRKHGKSAYYGQKT